MSETQSNGLGSIGVGALMIAIGAAITGATYSAASDGGSYVVTSGLFFVGGIQILVGIFRLVASQLRK